MKMSILIPAYNEETCLGALVRETACVLHGLGRSFEILVVDDGSSDWTPRLLNDLRAGDLRLLQRDPAPEHPGLVKLLYGGVFLLSPSLWADGRQDPLPSPLPEGEGARALSAVFGVLHVLLLALVSPAAGALLDSQGMVDSNGDGTREAGGQEAPGQQPGPEDAETACPVYADFHGPDLSGFPGGPQGRARGRPSPFPAPPRSGPA